MNKRAKDISISNVLERICQRLTARKSITKLTKNNVVHAENEIA